VSNDSKNPVPTRLVLDYRPRGDTDPLPNRPAKIAGWLAIAALINVPLFFVIVAMADRFHPYPSSWYWLDPYATDIFAGLFELMPVTGILALIFGIIGFKRSCRPYKSGRDRSLCGIVGGLLVLGVTILLAVLVSGLPVFP
jgi:hypothetical protein